MTQPEVPTLRTDNIPDLPYRLALDDLSSDHWEITTEENEKIAQAAKPNLIPRALAGDAEAMAELKKLHLTYWSVKR